MLFDGLGTEKRRLLMRVLNGDPLAHLKLSMNFYGTVLVNAKNIKDGVLPRTSLIQSQLGIPSKRKLNAGRPAFRVIDAPERKKKARGQLDLVTFLRALSLSQLQSIVCARIWRCHNCKMFFLAKDSRFRAYCTPGCGSKREATKAMERQRAANRAKKLRHALAAQKLCPPGWDWKRFVVSRTGLSQNFLTYAVKSGDLKDVGRTCV